MKHKIFSCNECRCKKFQSLTGLNVHLGKNHQVDYRYAIKNNHVIVVQKTKVKIQYIKQVQK